MIGLTTKLTQNTEKIEALQEEALKRERQLMEKYELLLKELNDKFDEFLKKTETRLDLIES